MTRRSQPALDPNAADTLEDTAASTANLPPVRTTAGSTVRLRSDAKAVERPPAPAPDATLPPTRTRREPTPRSKAPWIIAGGLIVAAAIIAIAVTRSPTAEQTEDVASADENGAEEETTPAAEPTVVSIEGQLGRAQQIVQSVNAGRIDEAMKSVDELARWGEQMSALGDAMREPGTTPPAPSDVRKAEPRKAPARAAKAPVVVGEGTLSVDSSPFATIYLDGTKLGPTPFFNQRVAAGKHELRAVLDDGRAQKRTVVIEDGKATNLGRLAW